MTTSADLLAILPTTQAEATSVRALAGSLGCSQRKVRALLRELVADRVRVVSLPQPNGVWIAESLEELARERGQLVGRLKELRGRIDDIEFAMQEMGWSPTLLDLLEDVA